MTKRKININRKSKDWKNKYPMVEIHWVDIVSDSSWQSFKQLKELQLPVCVTKGHLFSQDKGITRVFADYSLNDKKELDEIGNTRIDPQDRGLPFSTAVPLSVVLESRPTNNRPSLYHLMI
jgi:hypothetical protein